MYEYIMVWQILGGNPEKLTQIRLTGECTLTNQISWKEVMLFSVSFLALSVFLSHGLVCYERPVCLKQRVEVDCEVTIIDSILKTDQ